MAPSQPSGSGPVPAEVTEIERALSRIAYLITRARQHDRTAIEAGVPVNRAAVPILRLLAESGPLRPGEIAERLAVEPPHIARQVHLLEQAGYAEHAPDPGDRRARRVRLTASGLEATDRISQASRQGLSRALAGWTPSDLRQLAALMGRMTDDFIACAAGEDCQLNGERGRS